MGWMSLWKNQVLKVDDAYSLCSQPSIRHSSDVILRGKRLKNGDCEHQLLSFFSNHLEQMWREQLLHRQARSLAKQSLPPQALPSQSNRTKQAGRDQQCVQNFHASVRAFVTTRNGFCLHGLKKVKLRLTLHLLP